MSMELYFALTAYGNVYETRHKLQKPENFVKWTEENFKYVRYNPRKNINRYGLSVTSLDGGLSGLPDLDSLFEYNVENNTNFREEDFTVFTPVYSYQSLNDLLRPIENDIFRTHILRLDPGGYFPPHRDFKGIDFTSFRLIIPLENVNPPTFNFIIESQIIHWNKGSVYFLDTAKMHYLFNAGFKPSYMLVINVNLNVKTVEFVTNNLQHW